MSKINGYSHLKDRDAAIEALDKSQTRVANQEQCIRLLREQNDALEKRIRKSEPLAKDFQVIIDAVQGNELVHSAWEKLMVVLRLTGK